MIKKIYSKNDGIPWPSQNTSPENDGGIQFQVVSSVRTVQFLPRANSPVLPRIFRPNMLCLGYSNIQTAKLPNRAYLQLYVKHQTKSGGGKMAT